MKTKIIDKQTRRDNFLKQYPNHCSVVKTESDLRKEKSSLIGRYGAQVISLLKKRGLDYVIYNHESEYIRLKDCNLL